jgi:hypothetical protein
MDEFPFYYFPCPSRTDGERKKEDDVVINGADLIPLWAPSTVRSHRGQKPTTHFYIAPNNNNNNNKRRDEREREI